MHVGLNKNTLTFTKVDLGVVGENEVKHIKARTNGITILTKNGEVYSCRTKLKWRTRNKR
ncbi:MAG: hypothetical protein HFJ50_06845 [Clostridia bacterium]|nr:hypothetical protein [Clostridia bacterium]